MINDSYIAIQSTGSILPSLLPLLLLRLCNSGNHFQTQFRTTGNNTCRCCSLIPFRPPVFGTTTLFTFFTILPLASMTTLVGIYSRSSFAFAAAYAIAIGSVHPSPESILPEESADNSCTFHLLFPHSVSSSFISQVLNSLYTALLPSLLVIKSIIVNRAKSKYCFSIVGRFFLRSPFLGPSFQRSP